MATLPYSPGALNSNALTGRADFRSGADCALPFSVSRRLPPAIAAGQAYYWSFIWQRDQQESLTALEEGQGVTFDTAQDAIRWLLSDADNSS
jgi:hypothetical protein